MRVLPLLWEAETLECQQCGEVVRELTPQEAKVVAEKPYNFIVYCKYCKKDFEGVDQK